MRTVYLGTSEFAAAVLRRLADSPHRPVLVVTRPDRPRGRGRKLAPPPVAETARELGLELAQPETVNDEAALATIAAARPDAACVCAFGALIKEPLLSAYPMLNVHPSLLPRWRGAAPIERAIMSGDERTGVSIMQLTEGLDSGRSAPRRSSRSRRRTRTARWRRVSRLSGRTCSCAPSTSRRRAQPQDEALATYAEKIAPEDRELDPSGTAGELERIVRALTPHIGAYVALEGGERLGVRQARVLPAGGPAAGELSLDGTRPVLGCAEGALELLVVQPAGRRAMSGEDYLRGRRR